MKSGQVNVKRSERGYTLVALMGVMLFALILTTVAAPTIKYESQREREEEMLWRGHQVKNALAIYLAKRGNNQYPRELSELVEGIQDGVKKIRLLRPSALCDPMMPCEPGESNWRLVHPGDPLPKELLDALVSSQQQEEDGLIIPVPPTLRAFAQTGAVKLPGQESDAQPDSNFAPAGGPANTPGLDSAGKLPIIGVVSRKSDQMFRSYYGIEQYDHVLFFPGVAVVAGGVDLKALSIQAVGGGNAMQPGGGAVGGRRAPVNPTGQGQAPR
jgi:type II secretory pathway pseudopilin PulG